jgi:hypothetical protein
VRDWQTQEDVNRRTESSWQIADFRESQELFTGLSTLSLESLSRGPACKDSTKVFVIPICSASIDCKQISRGRFPSSLKGGALLHSENPKWAEMSSNAGKPPLAWRNFSTTVPIAAFRIKRDELRRLYQIVHSKQIEYRDKVMTALAKAPPESDQDFATRKQRVRDAFVTSVTVTGLNDEMIHGNDETFFDSFNFPEHLRSVYISTQSAPQAILNVMPSCNIIVFLDFSRPPLFDFSRLPTLPTPNESNFAISADDESWFSATKARLSQFFSERRTSTDWIHRAAVYDILLVFTGLPMAIWLAYRIVGGITDGRSPPIIISTLYVYVFFAAIQLFRILFSYSRWVFPKVELDTESGSPLRHRGIGGGIFLAIASSFLYDFLKSFFGS